MTTAASSRLIPVVDWNKYHPWPPLGGLRHLIFHGAENGFEAVIRRCGRRVLIDEQAFFAWAAGAADRSAESPATSGGLAAESHQSEPLRHRLARGGSQ